ncbi:MAG: hypothetical protein HZC28_18870 [Spirochaetes bacterium]|nr:hypothetical protein [Spirochaetota bacterium]
MKRLILVLALAAVALTGVFAKSVKTDGLALGVEWGGNYGFVNGLGAFGNNAAITFKLPSLPPMFGVSMAVGGSALGVGLTADWWSYRAALATGSIDVFMYVGPGIYANLVLGSSFNLDAGLRIPVGFQFYVLQPLELFIEPALAIGVGGIGNSLRIPTVGIQLQVGARFWF